MISWKSKLVHPLICDRDMGAAITTSEKEEAQERLKIFRLWFEGNVLQQDSKSAWDAVLVMPSGEATPDYRDEPNG